jgi:hypothetical protein
MIHLIGLLSLLEVVPEGSVEFPELFYQGLCCHRVDRLRWHYDAEVAPRMVAIVNEDWKGGT